MSSALLGSIQLIYVFERLEVTSASEIWLEEIDATMAMSGCYVARSESKLTYVDRPLAISLRADGASWRGRLSRDPCAVA
jgi:hypothetical protein